MRDTTVCGQCEREGIEPPYRCRKGFPAGIAAHYRLEHSTWIGKNPEEWRSWLRLQKID